MRDDRWALNIPEQQWERIFGKKRKKKWFEAAAEILEKKELFNIGGKNAE